MQVVAIDAFVRQHHMLRMINYVVGRANQWNTVHPDQPTAVLGSIGMEKRGSSSGH